jgi:nicotinamidase-related amidase
MPAVRGLEPGKRAALVVNEVQNAITNPSYIDTPLAGQVAQRGIVARINTLAAGFRQAGAPVIFCTIDAHGRFRRLPGQLRPGGRDPAQGAPGRGHRQRRHPRRPGRRTV